MRPMDGDTENVLTIDRPVTGKRNKISSSSFFFLAGCHHQMETGKKKKKGPAPYSLLWLTEFFHCRIVPCVIADKIFAGSLGIYSLYAVVDRLRRRRKQLFFSFLPHPVDLNRTTSLVLGWHPLLFDCWLRSISHRQPTQHTTLGVFFFVFRMLLLSPSCFIS